LTVELVRSLARCLPAGDRILFRPHPLENSYELQGLLRGLPNVEIREGGNIYDLFLEADAVIGTSSTALFEAAAFNRPVFVYDSPTADFYIPRRFGVWFKDAEDFLSQWARIAEEPMEGDPCMEKGWQNNYRRFLKRAAGVRA
jgi:CDP-glycerol glycerophosphotransferase (TagB/SpsB family)